METANCAEPPAKKKKGDKGNPPGIIDHPSGKKQARLPGFKVDGRACQKPIPGLFVDVPAAVAGQLEAQQKLASGGPEAVWPNWSVTAERNKRGEVRRSVPLTCDACLCSAVLARCLCR